MYMRGISAERRFPDKMCTGNVWWETSCPRIVQFGKRPVRETSVYHKTQVKSRMKEDLYPSSGFFEPIKTHLMCHTFSSHVNKYLKHSQQNIAKIRQLIPKTIQTSNIETPNNVNRRISISYLTELYLTSS